MNIIGIIPARFGSTRFPGKPLADIDGKTMIQRVYEQSVKCSRLSRVIIATDDERIFNHVVEFGGHAIMSSPQHQSGTDRCAEIIGKDETVKWDAIQSQQCKSRSQQTWRSYLFQSITDPLQSEFS